MKTGMMHGQHRGRQAEACQATWHPPTACASSWHDTHSSTMSWLREAGRGQAWWAVDRRHIQHAANTEASCCGQKAPCLPYTHNCATARAAAVCAPAVALQSHRHGAAVAAGHHPVPQVVAQLPAGHALVGLFHCATEQAAAAGGELGERARATHGGTHAQPAAMLPVCPQQLYAAQGAACAASHCWAASRLCRTLQGVGWAARVHQPHGRWQAHNHTPRALHNRPPCCCPATGAHRWCPPAGPRSGAGR